MALPRKIKNAILFQDGISLAGEVGTVTLPKLTRKVEEWMGGGMLGPIEIDLAQEKLELSFKAGGVHLEALSGYAADTHDAIMYRFVMATQRDDVGVTERVEAVIRGRVKEFDMGDSTVGELGETTLNIAGSYYKLTKNGITVIEVDMVNMRLTVNGKDRLAGVRAALGLASLGL
jgi:P2 family phage contractile tail tube protein